VVGETPNLAARLRGMAPVDGVIIADATRRLLGELFEYRNLGATEVKGFDTPVAVWQVLRPSTVKRRFEALRSTLLTPVVGRDADLIEGLAGR
jgi:class 3 adenylate cyclase